MKIQKFSHCFESGWKGVDQAASLDSTQTLVVAFFSPLYGEKPKALLELSQKFSQSKIIGCSTSGEINGEDIVDLSITAIAMKFEEASLKLMTKTIANAGESKDVGKSIATELEAGDLKSVIILSDGLIVNGSQLTSGINEVLEGRDIPVSGGLAGDGNYFKKTWVYSNGKAQSGLVAAVGLYGESLTIKNASKGGWDIFGQERTITKSQGNVLFEIDGQPALDLYKKYLGDLAKDLPSSALLFPLQIRADTASDSYKLVRTILSVDEQKKTVTFAGDVPVGYKARLMRANFENVIEAAYDVGSELSCDDESVSLAISCIGRRLVLGERAVEEVQSLAESLGANSSLVGFYSYGELGPHIEGGSCDLHNQSMTVLTIHENVQQQNKKAS